MMVVFRGDTVVFLLCMCYTNHSVKHLPASLSLYRGKSNNF